MPLSLSSGSEPNPHALAAISRAGEAYAIVASQDIVDARGVKLWARGQPVTSALQQRLLERRLLRPMESCLAAEGGVTVFSLLGELQAFTESRHPLASALRPWASVLVAQFKQVPLHSVAQLLLTATAATRPAALTHAVAGMALAGAMVASMGANHADIRLAMLGGLLQDIGEVYLDPLQLDHAQPLDLIGHRHVVVHPRVAQMLLSTLTDYPAALACAVAEHHERLDGSGYPARLKGDAVSTLGRVLAVVGLTLGAARGVDLPLTRASFALRVVPGEFDAKCVGFVCEAATAAREGIMAERPLSGATLAAQLAEIDRQMAQAQQLALDLREQGRAANITDVVGVALARLDRLRVAWNALGAWGLLGADLSCEMAPAERLELELAEGELRQRLRAYHRECLLLCEGLTEVEKLRLAPLWSGLVGHAA